MTNGTDEIDLTAGNSRPPPHPVLSTSPQDHRDLLHPQVSSPMLCSAADRHDTLLSRLEINISTDWSRPNPRQQFLVRVEQLLSTGERCSIENRRLRTAKPLSRSRENACIIENRKKNKPEETRIVSLVRLMRRVEFDAPEMFAFSSPPPSSSSSSYPCPKS